MMRLEAEPSARPADLAALMSLAMAMEAAAARRYADLAAAMEARGDPVVAETFRALLAGERDHAARVGDLSRTLTGGAPPAVSFDWELPPEIARSWDEIAASQRLTPYRALTIAVQNEERAFAFYAYVAANSADEAVRRTAEQLAAEELDHAAALRRERRRAFRRERASGTRAIGFGVVGAAEFARRSRELERSAAVLDTRIAGELRALGDAAGAALLERMAAAHAAAAGRLATESAAPGTASSSPSLPREPAQLWRAALAELERRYDAYVDMGDHAADEEVLTAAQAAAERAMRALGAVAARLHGLSA